MSGPNTAVVLVHLERPTSRARSIFQHLIEGLLGWTMQEVRDPVTFRSADAPKLFYGSEDIPTAICMIPCGILHEEGIRPWRVERSELNGIGIIRLDGAWDMAGAMFWLLSLYEELLPGERDAHGRMPASARTMFKLGLERTPIVDRWALDLARRMKERWPGLPEANRRYAHHVTVDVDNGMRYLGRPWVRQLGASVKGLLAGRISNVVERWQVVSGAKADPYDRFDGIRQLAQDRAERLLFFFLLRGNTAHDHATSPLHPVMRARIHAMARDAEAGIHPSYRTSEDATRLAAEMEMLRSIAGRPVRSSRQHFLRWRFPETLHQLEKLGITEEHSVGASDRAGFVVGTCTPFPFYSIAEERRTDIRLFPFAVMDSVLHDHRHLSTEEAFAEYDAFVQATRAVQGTLITVWHDRFLAGGDDREGWPALFERVLNSARS